MRPHARIGWKKKNAMWQIQATLFTSWWGQVRWALRSAATAQSLALAYNGHDSVMVHFTRKKKCMRNSWYFSSGLLPGMHIASWRLPRLAGCWILGRHPPVQCWAAPAAWATLSSWVKAASWAKKKKEKSFIFEVCTKWVLTTYDHQLGGDMRILRDLRNSGHRSTITCQELLVVSGSNTWAYLGLVRGQQAGHLWMCVSQRLREMWRPGKSHMPGQHQSAVTEAWLFLPEVICFCGAAFQPDDDFWAKSCFICARAFVVGTFFLVLDKHVI